MRSSRVDPNAAVIGKTIPSLVEWNGTNSLDSTSTMRLIRKLRSAK